MTDAFDLELRDRLAGLAAAVPVEAAGSTRVVRPRVASGTAGQRLALGGLVPVLAVVVIGTLIATLARVGPFAPAATNGDGPVVATVTDGPFDLTIRASKNRYAVGEAIAIDATMTYRGVGAVTIFHAQGAPVPGRGNVDGPDTGSTGGPIGFGIVEPVLGDLRLGANWAESCERTTLVPGQPLVVPFAKGGAWSSEHPRADEFRAFVLDPDLRLAAGEWHAFAVARYALDGCGGELHEPRAQLQFEVSPDAVIPTVDPAAPTPDIAPEPSAAAPFDTATDGPYTVELRSDRAVYRESDVIDGIGAFISLGEMPVDVWGLKLFFSITEPVYGMHVGDILTMECGRTSLEPGDRLETPFHKGGGVSGNDPLREFKFDYLNDSVFRLPPGTWHLNYGGSLFEGQCGQDTPRRSFSTTIEIVVLPEDGADVALATATEPNPDGICNLAPGGGTLAPNPRSGLGFENNGDVEDVIWPFGYSARRDGDGVVLVNDAGQDVARTGHQMVVGGASIDDDTFFACSVNPPA